MDDLDAALEKNIGRTVPLVAHLVPGEPMTLLGEATLIRGAYGVGYEIQPWLNEKGRSVFLQEEIANMSPISNYSFWFTERGLNLINVAPIREVKSVSNKQEATFHDSEMPSRARAAEEKCFDPAACDIHGHTPAFHGASAEVVDEVRTAADKHDEKIDNVATHALALNVHVNTPEDFEFVWSFFSENAKKLGQKLPYVNTESWLIGANEPGVDEEDLYHDEDTLNKTANAISKTLAAFRKSALRHDQVAQNIIDEMLNAGILFRERR